MVHSVKVWDRPYEVSVHQKSRSVWIAVGDHEGQRIETQGRTESQAIAGGVFCRGARNVTITDSRADSETPKVFVVMEFKAPFNELHREVLRVVCKEFGFDAVRADDTYGPGLIIADIEKRIQEAKFIIAEITPAIQTSTTKSVTRGL